MVTVASIILRFEGMDAFALNEGSLFVLGACICWGFENNCTKMISNKSPTEIVVIKGFFSGMGSLLIAFFLGERLPEAKWIAAILLLGFVAYGLSIKFYIMAQQHLGFVIFNRSDGICIGNIHRYHKRNPLFPHRLFR